MATKVHLEVLSGPIKGKVFEFSQHDTFIFGRGNDCHARLSKDPRVSRHHFLLEVNPPEVTLRDLRSLNGTHVNGVKYGGRAPAKAAEESPPAGNCQVRLTNGDRITVGKTSVLVRIEPPAAEPVAQRAEQSGHINVFPKRLCHADREEYIQQVYTPTSIESTMKQPDKAPAALPQAKTGDVGGVRKLIQQAVGQYREERPVEIEGYKLGGVLGQGGMGCVYRATRLLDDFPVAVKIMVAKFAAKDKARRRFLREIDVIQELCHPNIATLIQSGVADNAFYFVLDYCNGGSLADLVSHRGGKLSLKAFQPIMMQCLAGLEHAHQRGFVHRDIKPGNILLHQQGTGWVAKLADFGLAKQFEQAGFSGMTLTGAIGGTYVFLPREQLTDFKSTRPVSDVWSLGATFYQALTGTSPRECPKERDPMEIVLGEQAVPVRERDPSILPAFAAVLDKSLAFEATDRFQNASEMYQAFKGISW